MYKEVGHKIFWSNDVCSSCSHRGLELVVDGKSVNIICPRCSRHLTNYFFSKDLVVDLPDNALSAKIKNYLRARYKNDYLRTCDDMVAELFWDPAGTEAREVIERLADDLSLDRHAISFNEEILSSGFDLRVKVVYEHAGMERSDFSVRPIWSR